ncbi:MAG: zinc-binding alcohol dehydrogenase [Saprospiraceae bacterium]
MTSTALWHISPSESSLQEESLSTPLSHQLLIKSLYSLVSTGTEKLVATGQVPSSMHQLMRVPSMGGAFSFPVKYGYSLVGKVVSEGIFMGQLVHLLHPHQAALVTDSADVSLVPPNIPAKRAALASNMETALNAIWDSGVSIGDKVVVCGFGMIGGLVARLLSLMPAVEVVVLEKNAYRIQQATNMGFLVNPTDLSNFDYSFHTSGSSKGLQACIEAVGMEGKIIELSWYGTKSVQLQLGADFHYHRKQIISSQVGHVPFTKNARWDYVRRKAVVWKLLKNPVFDAHITDEVPFGESPAFFAALRQGDLLTEGLGWVFRYEG